MALLLRVAYIPPFPNPTYGSHWVCCRCSGGYYLKELMENIWINLSCLSEISKIWGRCYWLISTRSIAVTKQNSSFKNIRSSQSNIIDFQSSSLHFVPAVARIYSDFTEIWNLKTNAVPGVFINISVVSLQYFLHIRI